jgi:hypothetical protein
VLLSIELMQPSYSKKLSLSSNFNSALAIADRQRIAIFQRAFPSALAKISRFPRNPFLERLNLLPFVQNRQGSADVTAMS